jgi:hypothetical protein
LNPNCRIRCIQSREMYEHFTEILFRALKRCKRYYSLPYHWDGKSRQFTLIKDERYCRIFRMLIRFHYFYLLITIISLLLVFGFETNLILKISSVAVAVACSIITLVAYMHLTFHDVVPFLNVMIIFQRMNPNIGK